nr:MAG TPA: Protein of unknown function (DUF2576) [Caudoviricetes sp.]
MCTQSYRQNTKSRCNKFLHRIGGEGGFINRAFVRAGQAGSP